MAEARGRPFVGMSQRSNGSGFNGIQWLETYLHA